MRTALVENYHTIENKCSNLMSMDLTLLNSDITREWNRCSLTSNFFSLFQIEDEKIINSLSTIVNEFLENMARFSIIDHNKIDLTLKKENNTVYIKFNSLLTHKSAKRFNEILMSNEAKTLDQTIEGLKSDNFETNDLLLLNNLTLIHVYNMTLGCKMIDKGQVKDVSILLSINLKEVK